MKMFVDIFGIKLPCYGLMIVTGLIIANIINYIVMKKFKIDANEYIICAGYTGLGALLGAKLLYFITDFKNIDFSRLGDMEYLNTVLNGGFVFYGGFIGGILAFFIGCKVHNIKGGVYIKRLIFSIPLIHCFGRIGCFCAGCCYGIEYDGIFSVVFPKGSLAPYGTPLFPVQLAEAICLFVISAILFVMCIKKESYVNVAAYIIMYAILRFVLEYFRADSVRGSFLWFSTSQWISIFVVLLTIIAIKMAPKNKLKSQT